MHRAYCIIMQMDVTLTQQTDRQNNKSSVTGQTGTTQGSTVRQTCRYRDLTDDTDRIIGIKTTQWGGGREVRKQYAK